MHETLTGHEVVCRRRFHMERDIFKAMTQRSCESSILSNSRYVSVEEQLGIFLYAVSKNASNRTLQDQFQHSGNTLPCLLTPCIVCSICRHIMIF
jgi:hypothetical protein